MTMARHTLLCVGLAVSLACDARAQDTAVANVTGVYSPANGIGPEKEVMRRDPRDIAKSRRSHRVEYPQDKQSYFFAERERPANTQ